MEKIGLIAGNRKFPLVFAEAAKKKNYYIVAVAVKGETSPRLRRLVDKLYWTGLNEFSRTLEIFKKEGVNKLVMAGQISPRCLFGKKINMDSQLRDLLVETKDKKADTIFGAIVKKLEGSGFELLSSVTFMEDFLPKEGTLTERGPNLSEWEDIYFGLELAREIARLDIGQTVAVKNKAIVAVEALEGTDNLIRRAGKIARAGVVVVKVSKPKQDMRFDVPVVGLNTIKSLSRVSARCLAIEAEKTLLIDKEESVKLADKRGISVVAVE